jgi:hydroxyacylglutathione hydrolase
MSYYSFICRFCGAVFLLFELLTAQFFGRTAWAQGVATIPEVVSLKLSYSNVHLIRSSPLVLIDAGSPGDWDELTRQLAQHKLTPCAIGWVLITHAHQDHAGLASKFRQNCDTKIAMHRGDKHIAASGGFDPELKFTRWFSRIVWKFVDFRYPGFSADFLFDGPPGEAVSLVNFGLAGQVISLPGHTPGSIAVVLNDGRAFSGDMISGGYLGGLIHPGKAIEHFFHGDSFNNNSSLRALLRTQAHTFFLGHGGPVSRQSIESALTFLESKPHNDTLIHNPTSSSGLQ